MDRTLFSTSLFRCGQGQCTFPIKLVSIAVHAFTRAHHTRSCKDSGIFVCTPTGTVQCSPPEGIFQSSRGHWSYTSHGCGKVSSNIAVIVGTPTSSTLLINFASIPCFCIAPGESNKVYSVIKCIVYAVRQVLCCEKG